MSGELLVVAKPPLWGPGAVIIFAENRGGRVRVGARWRRPRKHDGVR